MLQQKLDSVKYKDLYDYIEIVSNKMSINVVKKVIVYKSKEVNAKAVSKLTIKLSQKLISFYDTKPNAIKLVLAHELAHIRNNDIGFRRGLWNALELKRDLARILIQETRADIEGALYSGLNKEEIQDSHMFLKEVTNEKDKKIPYKHGYSPRDKRCYYSTKYNKLDISVAEEVIGDFCMALKIKHVDKYLKLINSLI